MATVTPAIAPALVPVLAPVLAAPAATPVAEITSSNFVFGAVPFPGNPTAPVVTAQPSSPESLLHGSVPAAPTPATPATATNTEAPLGVLSNFSGIFSGTGFNTIFRPNNTTKNNTNNFPIAVNPPADNVLQLNLTTETLAFSTGLGSVPNRGSGTQGDIFLNGVPYVQTINDVTNTATGKADAAPTGIHFEPGLWMNIPPTTVNPVLADTVCRMASIPHGTTIKAEGVSPTTTTNGPPTIPAVSITPFLVGNPSSQIPFPSQTASTNNTSRLPQDLSKFIAAGTITQDILTDPNTVLRNAIKGQNITKTVAFSVTTSPAGENAGTANIAFLQGSTQGNNAFVPQMTATFWIEQVQHVINIPIFHPGSGPLLFTPLGVHGPKVSISPPSAVLSPIKISVPITQIQYSQTVLLNFKGLSWPHVSVATLIPSKNSTISVPWPA